MLAGAKSAANFSARTVWIAHIDIGPRQIKLGPDFSHGRAFRTCLFARNLDGTGRLVRCDILVLQTQHKIQIVAVDRFGIGMVVYAIVWIYVGGVTQSFSNDRSGGTLHLLFGSPASRASAYFARGVGHFYNGPLTAVSTTLLAVLLIDLNVGDLNYLTYTVSVVVISIGILMVSLLLGNFAALYQDWFLFSSIGYGGLLGLTGLIIPVDRLPTALEVVAQGLPITHGLKGLRGAFAGDSVASVAPDLLLELAVAAAYALVGLAVFTLIDRAARQRGILAGGEE